jgi:predicted Na+-dependent transporter
MWSRARQAISSYPELVVVIVAATIGLCVQSPLAWVAAHQGINILLAVLVFATAVTIEAAALRRVTTTWAPLLGSVAAGVTVLPALAWVASRVVSAGSLRDGVLTVGLAPCEIASVATTAMARGEAALSAGVLVGSTIATIAVAGPVLSLEAGRASVHPGHIAVNLLLVVALPLAAGIGIRAGHASRAGHPIGSRTERAATITATLAVAALVALIAAEVHLSVRYVAVAGALVIFLAGSAALGTLIGVAADRPAATAVLLTTSMRDFAIAASLATSAFGSAASAPLGLYGIFVLVWGTATAGLLRQRNASRVAPIRPEG